MWAKTVIRVTTALALADGVFGKRSNSGIQAQALGTVLTDAQEGQNVTDCMKVPGFAGKCLISASPGACYTLPGDNPAEWACWVRNQSLNTQTDASCKDASVGGVSRRGACRFSDHGKTVTDADLPSCLDVAGFQTQCSPLSDKWGACYKSNSQQWMCVPQGHKDIAKLRLDCKVTVDNTTGSAYDGACVFGNFKQRVYKCDTVPTYNRRAAETSCAGPPQGVGACFSLVAANPWQCAVNASDLNPSCITTMSALAGKTYDGACVFSNHSDYAVALDASSLAMPTTASTTTAKAATDATTPSPAARSTTRQKGAATQQSVGAAAVLLVLATAVSQ